MADRAHQPRGDETRRESAQPAETVRVIHRFVNEQSADTVISFVQNVPAAQPDRPLAPLK